LPILQRLSGVAVAAVPAEFAGLNPGLQAGDVNLLAEQPAASASLDELRQRAEWQENPATPSRFLVERYEGN